MLYSKREREIERERERERQRERKRHTHKAVNGYHNIQLIPFSSSSLMIMIEDFRSGKCN